MTRVLVTITLPVRHAVSRVAQPAVFVSDGKVYKVSNQDKVVAHAGHKVTLSGTMDGDTIKVDSVKM